MHLIIIMIIFINQNIIAIIAEASSRGLFTGEQVLDLIDSDNEDVEDGFDEIFFPGSDDELGFAEVEDDRFVK